MVALFFSGLSWGASQQAKVTFFRYAQFYGSLRKIDVYCDGEEVAKLANRSYFSTDLIPGRHVCSDKKDRSRGTQPLEIIMEPGAEYFVQVGWVNEGAVFKSGFRPLMALVDPITIGPLFRELKPLKGSLEVHGEFGHDVDVPQEWDTGFLLDITHESHPSPGTQTPDDEWTYTVKAPGYTFVGSERTHRLTGFSHIGIAVGDEIKFANQSGANGLVIRDAAGRARPLQLIKMIRNEKTQENSRSSVAGAVASAEPRGNTVLTSSPIAVPPPTSLPDTRIVSLAVVQTSSPQVSTPSRPVEQTDATEAVKPKPSATEAKLELTITSDPSAAAVEINGVSVGTTPVTVALAAGTTCTLSVKREGFEPWVAHYPTAVAGKFSMNANLTKEVFR